MFDSISDSLSGLNAARNVMTIFLSNICYTKASSFELYIFKFEKELICYSSERRIFCSIEFFRFD